MADYGYGALRIRVTADTSALEATVRRAATGAAQDAGKRAGDEIGKGLARGASSGMAAVGGAARSLVSGVASAAGSAGAAITSGLSRAFAAASTAASRAASAASSAWGKLGEVAPGITSGLSRAFAAVSTAAGRAASAASSVWSRVSQAASPITTGFSRAFSAVSSAAGRAASAASSAWSRVSQAASSITTGFGRAFAAVSSAGERAASSIGSAFAKLGGGAGGRGGAPGALGGLLGLVKNLGGAGLVGAGGMAALAGSVLKTGVSYNTLSQTSRAAFKTILGSGAAADKMMSDLAAFAKTSPFPRQAFIEATQQMLSFGVASNKVIPYLGSIQDAVAATGGSAQTLSEITLVMSQIQAAGKITGVDLMQFAQRGINAADLIGSQMGKTGTQIKEEIGKGTFDATKALDLMTAGMNKKFGGAADNVKQTWAGTTDRIKGAMRDMGSALVAPFIDPKGGGYAVKWGNQLATSLRQAIPAITTAMQGVASAIGVVLGFLDRFSAITGPIAIGIGVMVAALVVYKIAMGVAAVATWAWGAALAFVTSPLGITVIAIGALVAIVIILYTKFAWFRTVVTVTWNAIRVGATVAFNAIKVAVTTVFGWIRQYWPLLLVVLLGPIAIAAALIIKNWAAIKGAALAMWNVITGAARSAFAFLANLFGPVWQAIVGVFQAVAVAWSQWWAQNGEAIKRIWNAVVLVFQLGWQAIMAQFNLARAVITAVWNALWAATAFVVQLYWAIITTTLRAAWAVIVAIFNWGRAVITGIWNAIWPVLAPVMTAAWAAIVAVVRVYMAIVTGVIQVGWAIITGIFRLAWAGIVAVLRIGWTLVVGIFTIFINLITGRWGAAWTALKNMLAGVWTAMVNLVRVAVSVLLGVVTAGWNAVRGVTAAIWAAIQAVLNAAWAAIRAIVSLALAWVQARITIAWTAIRGLTAALWAQIGGVITGAWNGIKNTVGAALGWVQSQMSAAWNAIAGTASKAWGGIRDGIGKVWEGVKAKVLDPVRHIVNNVINKLVNGINSLITKIGMPKIPTIPGFAEGGRVPGGWGGGDRVPILAEPGEWMLTKRQARAIGYSRLRSLPRYAGGGEIGHPSHGPQLRGPFDFIRDLGGAAIRITHVDDLLRLGKDVVDTFSGMLKWAASEAFKAATEPLRKLAQPLADEKVPPGNLFRQYTGKLAISIIDKAIEFIQSKSASECDAGGVVAHAMQFDGKPYRWGGPANPSQGFDCSSFVSFIAGSAGLPLPGGFKVPSGAHGPVTTDYLRFGGMKTIGRDATRPGDVAVSPTHIGFIIGPGGAGFAARSTATGIGKQSFASGYTYRTWGGAAAGAGTCDGGTGPGGPPNGFPTGVKHYASIVQRVCAALGIPWATNAFLSQMASESGGNPRAINNWDSNARRGTPSKGLLQLIDPTFNAYAGQYRGRGIWDPLANIYAGINYAKSRYGSRLLQVIGRGHGYAAGGVIAEPVVGMGLRSGAPYAIAERGPELVSPLRSGMTAAERAVAAGSGRGSTVINVYPQPGQSEEAIAAAVSRRLAWAEAGGRS